MILETFIPPIKIIFPIDFIIKYLKKQYFEGIIKKGDKNGNK